MFNTLQSMFSDSFILINILIHHYLCLVLQDPPCGTPKQLICPYLKKSMYQYTDDWQIGYSKQSSISTTYSCFYALIQACTFQWILLSKSFTKTKGGKGKIDCVLEKMHIVVICGNKNISQHGRFGNLEINEKLKV